ncbi:MAG: sulfatase [Bacteroidales bacterium]|nr:sulfatase [Bacteroidales bacterium]MCF8389336.1 sulfatase [Bacteroidales bacterium]
MKISNKLSLAAIFLGVSCMNASTQKDQEQPNIVFVLADDLGWNGLSSYGNSHVNTPNIDRLAEEGVKFTDAYAMPQCSPTRFTFMTGQYSARTNMNAVVKEKHVMPFARMIQPESTRILPPESITIGKVMRTAGYSVGTIGKWHVDLNESENKKLLGNEKYLDQYGFDALKVIDNIPDEPKNVMNYTNAALNYLDVNRDKPSLVYIAHNTVHTKLEAPADLIQKYVKKGYTKSPDSQGSFENKPTADYLAMIDYLDKSIGVLMEGIRELNLPRETLVIFMSDNGGLDRVWDCAPLRRGKGSEYEGGVRVPLVMYWPGRIEAGKIVTEPVHIVDMFPTFMELGKGKINEEYIVDGESLLPLMLDQGSFEREAIYMNTPLYIPHYNKTPSCFIRMGDYKLIKFYGDYLEEDDFKKIFPQPKIELFNLRDDLSEKNDLSKIMPEKANEMEKMLDAWLKETGAKTPVVNKNFDPERWRFATAHKVDENGESIYGGIEE